MKIKILAVLLLLPLLISCSEKATNPVLSSSTLVKATITPILISTQTLSPTPSITATASRTPFFFPTTPAQATEQAVADQYCNSRDFPHPRSFLPSKSGKLMAFVCWPADEKEVSVTKVIALDGSRPAVQASYRKEYLGLDDSKPIPPDIQEYPWIENAALFPVHWTEDDKFLYMVRNSPASGVQYPPQIFAMMRLDVETGKVTPVLPLALSANYYYDFSEDGTKLLSVEEVKIPLIVKVTDTVTGTESKIYLDKRFDQAGFFRLSPDASKLLISALDDEKGYSIILANLRSGSQTYLDDHYDFFMMSWVDEHTIYGSGRENGNVFFFYLNTITMQTSPAPDPTPIPTETPEQ